jgi:hypothetical protein
LPQEEVGEGLLVRLWAERLIIALKLKEDFEAKEGWNYDDLCEFVVARLGADESSRETCSWAPGELRSRHPETFDKIVRNLNKWSRVISVSDDGVLEDGHLSCDVMLMLGLGNKYPVSTKLLTFDGLAEKACEAIGCAPGKLRPSAFRKAVKDVKQLYGVHVAKSQLRARHARLIGGEANSPTIGSMTLLQKLQSFHVGSHPKALDDIVLRMFERNWRVVSSPSGKSSP